MTTESLNLQKGERVDLTKTNPSLQVAAVGLGWDVNASSGNDFDLDAFAILLGSGSKIPDNTHIIFFNNKTGHGVVHSGDNLTGAGDGDDEVITITLNSLPSIIEEVILGVNIFKAEERRQNFGQVQNAFIRIFDDTTKNEILKYDLSEDHSTGTGMLMGKLYKKDGEWKFQALGNPVTGDINQIAAQYR